MKERLISKKYIKKAYTPDLQNVDMDINLESIEDKVELLPKEMFQIIGKVISYIENINKIEGEKNENK